MIIFSGAELLLQKHGQKLPTESSVEIYRVTAVNTMNFAFVANPAQYTTFSLLYLKKIYLMET